MSEPNEERAGKEITSETADAAGTDTTTLITEVIETLNNNVRKISGGVGGLVLLGIAAYVFSEYLATWLFGGGFLVAVGTIIVWKKLKWQHRGVLILLSVVLLYVGWVKLTEYSGRTMSRYFGEGMAQTLEVPVGAFVIDISVRGNGVKDVTYRTKDGEIFTQEYHDWSPLEGLIQWMPHEKGADWIQKRGFSRWGLDVVKLALPKGCPSDGSGIVGVSITPIMKKKVVKKGSKEETEPEVKEVIRNVSCRLENGEVVTDEYRPGLIARNFGGRIKIDHK